MTQNQIAFAKAVEEERHNRANENFDLYKNANDMAFKVWEQYMKDASSAGSDAANAKTLIGRTMAQGRRVSSLAQASMQMNQMSKIQPSWYDKLNERNAESSSVISSGRRSGMTEQVGRRYYE